MGKHEPASSLETGVRGVSRPQWEACPGTSLRRWHLHSAPSSPGRWASIPVKTVGGRKGPSAQLADPKSQALTQDPDATPQGLSRILAICHHTSSRKKNQCHF